MIKQSIKQTLMAITLVTGIALTLVPMASQAKAVDGYSGEALLLGIFMAHGPVAEQLPEVHAKAPTAEQEAALAQVDPEKVLAVIDEELARSGAAGAQEEVEVLEAVKARVQARGLTPNDNPTPFSFDVLVEKVHRHDATFFERFAQSIQSGNHLRIRKALREGHDVLSELWLSQGVGMLGDSMLASDSFTIKWTTVYTDTAVYTRSVVYEDKYVFGWFSLTSQMDGALAEELLVNAIAQNLVVQ